ncbi:MAG: DUF4363 family protein [Firmicutes bacterium]|nr:DUF4363 family protein [Bacillota bacterium]
MFDRMSIRGWLSVAWLVAFVGMWLSLGFTMPKQLMVSEINKLETAVVNENWEDASLYMDNLDTIWDNNKLLIQLNNGSEELSAFQRMLQQTKVLVKYQDDDVMDHIGELREGADSVAEVFPEI